MVDRFGEVLSRPDGGNILEDGRFAEMVDECVTQPTGVCGGVIAAVAEEYSNDANSVLRLAATLTPGRVGRGRTLELKEERGLDGRATSKPGNDRCFLAGSPEPM